MKRLALAAVIAAALLVPATIAAQSPDPAASPGAVASPGVVASAAPAMSPEAPIGVDTMDVCLSITGPVTLLTAESLTQGIIDGTFVINGLSTECEPLAAASPGASPMAGASPVAPASPAVPMASPAASPAA